MTLSYPHAAAEVMEHLCAHDSHGYSQYSRYGEGGSETVALSDGTQVAISLGDRDCSSAVINAYEAVGVDCGGATYTGNMRSCMTGTGNFAWRPMSYIAQRGDIYLNEKYHTAMCTSAVPDLLAEFSISETGGIDGAEGDQTGNESHVRSYYSYPWDGILVYVGPEREDDMPTADEIANAVWNFDQNGTLMRDRVQGTDEAANTCRAILQDTSDPTGRGKEMTTHDHVKWIGASASELTRTDDPTGCDTEAKLYDRICYMAQKQEAMQESIDALAQAVGEIADKLE